MPELVQRSLACAALIVLMPLLAVLSLLVRLTSPGPVIYRAERVGRRGTFILYKFRSMTADAARMGPGVTMAQDPRVTRFGRYLRSTKLDELPQLWNVVRGEMLLVGPRPEDPRYIDMCNPLHQEVFAARPGLTGLTALAYRDEETLLASAAQEIARAEGRSSSTTADLDLAYRERILPAKLAMDADYLRHRSTRGDLAIIGRTIGQVLQRAAHR